MSGFEPEPDPLDSGAIFSPCHRWRYLLWRRWDARRGTCAFIGLNPSTADETVNDPTVRRCINFAKRWGYGRLLMLNVFAYRATQPSELKRHTSEAVGPRNDEFLLEAGREADILVAAWGTHATLLGRNEVVRSAMARHDVSLYHLGLTKDGHPKHPLYLPGELEPQRWVA